MLRSWDRGIPVTFLSTLRSTAMHVCRHTGGGGVECLHVGRETQDLDLYFIVLVIEFKLDHKSNRILQNH